MHTTKREGENAVDRRGRIRGLYGIADADASDGDPERAAAAFLAGGCRVVQVRCKGWSADDLLAAARAVRARCEAVGALLIVNDHPEVAVAAGADGVHVGQEDAPSALVRRVVGPARLIGRSTNALDQLAAAIDGADYVAFGPVWATDSAGRDKGVRGLDALAEARRRVPAGVPLVAIGGITAARLPEVVARGVDAWAVIAAVTRAADPVAAARALLAPAAAPGAGAGAGAGR